eukprot:UN23914
MSSENLKHQQSKSDLEAAKGGWEASFVDEVPDFLLCSVCHLPFRNPIQILTCGHKFCAPCYQQLKSCAHAYNVQLFCPLDRDVVDEKQVFADKGLERIVGNLKVKCGHAGEGCEWTGHLRDLSDHQQQTCRFAEIAQQTTSHDETETTDGAKNDHVIQELSD